MQTNRRKSRSGEEKPSVCGAGLAAVEESGNKSEGRDSDCGVGLGKSEAQRVSLGQRLSVEESCLQRKSQHPVLLF